ncbi:antibiotic biosynthesis monooxygenase family protein [Gracilibacillus salinarum]|uniref:Antibiotic biosynthesis monooxygenase n=1 Tax=Gracilibacillus salinarum TaxID=2932255 RepID=A0ABY4GT78_9BACI|nr:antibiotic biosynthesis monooxygenase family protein [Gracilibacillus salinarum]UOQ86437.1 antibiotic biosynthesis monooxygenase [Gracilibacillus salinarum]
MYIVHSIFDVPAEKADEVIHIYKKRSRMVDKWPGFIDFQLLQNDRKPGELTVQISWESKQAYLDWVTSEEYQRIHDLEKKYPDKELANIVPKVYKYKVVAQ